MKRYLHYILPAVFTAILVSGCETEPVAIEPEGTDSEEQPLVITFSETNLDVMADTLEDQPRIDSSLIINVVDNIGTSTEKRFTYSVSLRNKGNGTRFLDYGKVQFGPVEMIRKGFLGNIRYDLFFESAVDYSNRNIGIIGDGSGDVFSFNKNVNIPPFLRIENIPPDTVINLMGKPLKVRLDRVVNPDVLYFSIVPDKVFNGPLRKGKPYLNVRVTRSTRGFILQQNILRQLVSGFDKKVTRFYFVVSNQKVTKTDVLEVTERPIRGGQKRSVPVFYRNRFVVPVYFSR